MARGGRPAARDDVTAVRTVLAGSAEELLAVAQGSPEFVAQGGRVAPRESELVAVERQEEFGTVRRDCCLGVRDAGFTPGEFLDQERGYSGSYTRE